MIAAAIRDELRARGMSRRELAKQAGLYEQSVSRALAHGGMSTRLAEKLMSVLALTVRRSEHKCRKQVKQRS